MLVMGGGARDQQAYGFIGIGLMWTAVAAITIVTSPSLDICRTGVVALTPARAACALTTSRSVASLVPSRTATTECV